jgi:hypothetical protein
MKSPALSLRAGGLPRAGVQAAGLCQPCAQAGERQRVRPVVRYKLGCHRQCQHSQAHSSACGAPMLPKAASMPYCECKQHRPHPEHNAAQCAGACRSLAQRGAWGDMCRTMTCSCLYFWPEDPIATHTLPVTVSPGWYERLSRNTASPPSADQAFPIRSQLIEWPLALAIDCRV